MSSLSVISVVIAASGLLLIILGLVRLFRRRWLAGFGMGSTGLGVLAVAAISVLFASNLRTYQRLVYEMPVARVSFLKVSSRRFTAELTNITTGETMYYELLGDEWQLDAQIITWHGLATVFGLDPQYRLQRISGRYADTDQELSSQRSVYDLMTDEPVKVWSFVKDYQQWATWVDTSYGTAVFLPMVNRGRYIVSISRTGLTARPDNQAAEEAVGLWNRI
jgi:hypothetical protein